VRHTSAFRARKMNKVLDPFQFCEGQTKDPMQGGKMGRGIQKRTKSG